FLPCSATVNGSLSQSRCIAQIIGDFADDTCSRGSHEHAGARFILTLTFKHLTNRRSIRLRISSTQVRKWPVIQTETNGINFKCLYLAVAGFGDEGFARRCNFVETVFTMNHPRSLSSK